MSKKNKSVKIIKFLTIVLLFLLLILSTRFLALSKNTPPTSSNAQPTLIPVPTSSKPYGYTSVSTLSNIPQEEKIQISEVSVNNFFKEATGPYDIYIMRNGEIGEVKIATTDAYSISYFPLDEDFVISIIKYPFEDYLEEAENAFVQNLGILKKDSCKLDVYITAPRFANPELAGEIFGLSWCK
jgi:hypothetical protein